jgi:uncharacterized protein YndB with AHSA1/START domain
MNSEFLNIPAECEIVTRRTIGASSKTVFRAWTDPDMLKEWWGPAGFTNTFHEFDLRPGGKWRFTMHGPEKGNYQNECIFLRIEEPVLIAWDRISQPLFRVVAMFEELAPASTYLTFRMQFDTKENCDKIKKFAVDKNEENFDKLEKLLGLKK